MIQALLAQYRFYTPIPYVKPKNLKEEVSRVKKLMGIKEVSVKREDRDEIYRDDNVIIVAPLTHFAACKYGANTRWCTSTPSSDQAFNAYANDVGAGLVYVIMRDQTGKEKKYAVSFDFRTDETEIYDQTNQELDEVPRELEPYWDKIQNYMEMRQHQLAEGLNLPKKQEPVYNYYQKCYPKGDGSGWSGEIYDDDECLWARSLQKDLEEITKRTDRFEIKDIRLFDKYQGPYAIVKIDGTQYKIWTVSDEGFMGLWIEDYPIENTSFRGENLNPGFQGRWDEIVDVIEHPEQFQNN